MGVDEGSGMDKRVGVGVGVGVAAVALLFGWAVASGAPPSEREPAAPSAPRSMTVTYQVDGTANAADVTMQTPSGTRQQSAVTLPMVPEGQSAYPPGLVVSGFRSGDFLYVSAQRAYSHGGGLDVTCAIEVNGVVVAQNSSSGEFTIVTCQAVAP